MKKPKAKRRPYQPIESPSEGIWKKKRGGSQSIISSMPEIPAYC